ncbi:extracellular solute-binding protein [Paenibacillus ginsengarvi]|nr:extracellular solute-binding protein [Paenibacillus ginsengarvi]
MKGRPTTDQFLKQLQIMVDQLRDEIRGGVHAAGAKLPSEKQLAARFGLGNNSIRKGLDMLVAEGLIEKIPRVGNRIKPEGASRTPVTLTLVCMPISKLNLELSGLLAEFGKMYPWITVKIKHPNVIPEIDDQGNMEPFDLIMMSDYQFRLLAEDGHASKLEALSEHPDLYPQLSSLFSYDGTLYLQPLIFSPIVLCYNKAHFRECGLAEPDGSWTWDDLMRSAEKLYDGRGRYGFCYQVHHMNRWPIFLLQSCERFEWEGTRLKELRGTRLLESMNVCKSIIQNRKVFPMFLSEGNNTSLQMFLEGKLSMVLNSYMGLNMWKDAKIDYDISPIPFIDEPRTMLIGMGVGINTGSEQKEEAKLLIDFLTSPLAQQFISQHTLSLPATRHLPPKSGKTMLRRPERYPLFREILFSCRAISELQLPMSSFSRLFYQLKAYWADMIDEDELCERIVQSISQHDKTPYTVEIAP